jgi:DNA-binding CsgD family transcriptional regulator
LQLKEKSFKNYDPVLPPFCNKVDRDCLLSEAIGGCDGETAQKSEVRSQKSEVRSQKSEGRRQKAEVRPRPSGGDLVAGEELHVGDNSLRELAATADIAKPPVDLSLLTPRQLEVLRCFVDTPHEPPIAHRLGIRAKTVKVHLLNIQNTLQVCCRVELMKVALQALGGDIRDGPSLSQRLTPETSEND